MPKHTPLYIFIDYLRVRYKLLCHEFDYVVFLFTLNLYSFFEGKKWQKQKIGLELMTLSKLYSFFEKEKKITKTKDRTWTHDYELEKQTLNH